jgi:LemA protein
MKAARTTATALAMWVLAGISGCGYNTMVEERTAVERAWADVDAQLQRRNDLVPNLVQTVKGYAKHEEKVFTAVAEARSKVAGAPTPQGKIAAAGELSGALSRLLAVAERYPELKADRTFIRLSDELAGTENRIAVARTRYNGAVETYNSSVAKFPGLITARLFHFEKKPFFEAAPVSKEAPKVDFGG